MKNVRYRCDVAERSALHVRKFEKIQKRHENYANTISRFREGLKQIILKCAHNTELVV